MPSRQLDVAPMSVEQAAAVLRVSRYTLIRFTDVRYTPAEQQLRAEKTDAGEWRIERADLAAFIANRSIAPHGEQSINVTANELPRMHSLEEVAARHELPLRWLQARAAAGEIPHVKAGRAIRMTGEQIAQTVQIREAIESHRNGCGAAA